MRARPVQFAVVREDPAIEAEIVRRLGVRRALLIASGGCTALSLMVWFPSLELTLVDPNAAQLDLVRRKLDLLPPVDAASRRRQFNIGTADPAGLNACGNFESLFGCLRHFLHEFVAHPEELAGAFATAHGPAELLASLGRSPYWPVAFALHFHDDLLNAMFSKAATQHAPPASYPAYFRQAFEHGLGRPDAMDNYFLHHVFLGHYVDRAGALPAYLEGTFPVRDRPEMLQGGVADVPDLGEFDLVSLSNIFDWMPESEVAALARHLTARMRPGAAVLYRQLNHAKDFTPFFGDGWRREESWAADLLARDRSLFYARLVVLIQRQGVVP